MAAKAMMQRLTEALGGVSKPLDLDAFKVENDPLVIAARKAEDEAARKAHELEDASGQLAAAREHADAQYTATAADGDEAKVREARRVFISADESVRARREHVRRAQLAATAARQRREAEELAAEQRAAARIREALAVEAQSIAQAVETVLVPAFARAELLAKAAEQLSPWGSPTARRIGLLAGMGTTAQELFTARGQVHRLGARAIGGAFLEDPYAPDGSVWGTWKKSAAALGLIESKE